MMTLDDQFEVFRREHAAWWRDTQAMPFRRDRESPKTAFELDLDHLVDYVQPILVAAADHSTQFEYPRVSEEYLHDLDRIESQMESGSLTDSDQKLYSAYFVECRHLLASLGSLPVPAEGHLGFRRSALHAFAYLIDEYDFVVTETSPISVRFEKDELVVIVEYSPACPMSSILVAKRVNEQSPTSGFVLDDFAYVAGLGVIFDYGQFDFGRADQLSKFLEMAGTLLHRYGGQLLSGDGGAFREFQSKADERERLYVEELERHRSSPKS